MAYDLYDTDIPWGLPPAPMNVPQLLDPSTPDVTGMLFTDLLAAEAHASSVTADLAISRELVQLALDRISELTATVQKQSARLADQSRQIP